MTAAIRELQGQGYRVPDFPEEPRSEEEKEIRARYAKVLGSAVNPVLREGNSDRRVAAAVKQFAKKHPHRMGAWSPDSKSHVASMKQGDFYSSEKSLVVSQPCQARIEHRGADGRITLLKDGINLQANEVIDAAVMSSAALREFLQHEIDDAKAQGVLWSLHLKATMMKVSDPIIFGHAVRAFFQPVFDQHGALLTQLGVEPDNGLGDLYAKLQQIPEDQHAAVIADLEAVLAVRPRLAMVNSDKGITNLHVPSDTIIDASMPAAIRESGKMWGPDGELHDMKAVIPDRSYAGVYQETMDFCKKHGAFDVATMGNVANVGLMAQKAEEYGSHNKTFEISAPGEVCVVDSQGEVMLRHNVEEGDIWRMCQTKDAAIRDWVKLAIQRARATGTPAVFWLDENRAHDANLIARVNHYLPEHDLAGVEVHIMSPIQATRFTCQRAATDWTRSPLPATCCEIT